MQEEEKTVTSKGLTVLGTCYYMEFTTVIVSVHGICLQTYLVFWTYKMTNVKKIQTKTKFLPH